MENRDEELKEYYKTHSRQDTAKKFGVTESFVSRTAWEKRALLWLPPIRITREPKDPNAAKNDNRGRYWSVGVRAYRSSVDKERNQELERVRNAAKAEYEKNPRVEHYRYWDESQVTVRSQIPGNWKEQ